MLAERIANPSDRSFIRSCILNGARKGIFSLDIDKQAIRDSMEREIDSVIHDHFLGDGRRCEASIYKDRDRRIATSIICEAEPGLDVYELYLVAVRQSSRGSGHGSYVVDELIDRLQGHTIIARCSNEAVMLRNMLMRRGFTLYNKDRGFDLMLLNTRDRIDPLTTSACQSSSDMERGDVSTRPPCLQVSM